MCSKDVCLSMKFQGCISHLHVQRNVPISPWQHNLIFCHHVLPVVLNTSHLTLSVSHHVYFCDNQFNLTKTPLQTSLHTWLQSNICIWYSKWELGGPWTKSGVILIIFRCTNWLQCWKFTSTIYETGNIYTFMTLDALTSISKINLVIFQVSKSRWAQEEMETLTEWCKSSLLSDTQKLS